MAMLYLQSVTTSLVDTVGVSTAVSDQVAAYPALYNGREWQQPIQCDEDLPPGGHVPHTPLQHGQARHTDTYRVGHFRYTQAVLLSTV